jgi:hypothetical protein
MKTPDPRQLGTRREMENQVIEKVWSDPGFRRDLVADPKAALAKTLGVELPASVKVTVLEESDNQYYVVVPQKPVDRGELSEKELQTIAGGAVTREERGAYG